MCGKMEGLRYMEKSSHKEYELDPIDVGELLKDFQLGTDMVIFLSAYLFS